MDDKEALTAVYFGVIAANEQCSLAACWERAEALASYALNRLNKGGGNGQSAETSVRVL